MQQQCHYKGKCCRIVQHQRKQDHGFCHLWTSQRHKIHHRPPSTKRKSGRQRYIRQPTICTSVEYQSANTVNLLLGGSLIPMVFMLDWWAEIKKACFRTISNERLWRSYLIRPICITLIEMTCLCKDKILQGQGVFALPLFKWKIWLLKSMSLITFIQIFTSVYYFVLRFTES